MSAKHDITANQGETLNFHVLYTDNDGTGVDLTNYTAEMKVKRSSKGTQLLHLTSIAAGEGTGITAGVTGASYGMTGGISLNRSAGNSGGQTGGILVIAGATAMSFVPEGRHLYDLELKTPQGSKVRLIEGRFESDSEITK
tara:strand:- start:1061 stop:1483 length:423 start_codon:yes stop_codon:yes gene_type:complete